MSSRHGFSSTCIRCQRTLSSLKIPIQSNHISNFNHRLGRRNYRKSFPKDKRLLKSNAASQHKTRQFRLKETEASIVPNQTEQHPQSTSIRTPKTIIAKRAIVPRRDTSEPRPRYTPNAWKYHHSADHSQYRADVQERARLVPLSVPMQPGALKTVVSRMFALPAKNTAPHSKAEFASPSSNAHPPTTNFFSNFTPPKLSPRQGTATSIPSADLQIIRRLNQIRLLQKRSFSQACEQKSGDDSVLPPISASNSLTDDNDGFTRRTLPVQSQPPPPYFQRRRYKDEGWELSKKQLLQGPPLISASRIYLSSNLRGIQPGPHRNFNPVNDRPANSASIDANRINSIDNSTPEASQGPFNEEPSSKLRSSDMKRAGRQTFSFQEKLLSIVEAILKQKDDSTSEKIPDTASAIQERALPPAVVVKASDETLWPPPAPRKTVGLLPQLPAGESILTDVVTLEEQLQITRLAHGLDRVLFNPSFYWLQDPHSKVFNFSPDLQTLPSVTDFAFERLPKYKYSSEDDRMLNLAVQYSKPFIGSTSTLTKILSHIYFLLSEDKLVDLSTLSMAYADQSRKFTPGMRMPTNFTLRRRLTPSGSGRVWAVDASRSEVDERHAEWNVLLWLGTMMEKFLTYPKEQFDNLRRSNSPSPSFRLREDETYRYAKSSKFIMRSQLDCQDSRLPGTGVFDLKSRAVLPIRIDQLNIQEHSGYLIRQTTGLYESFEREYYDLIRSAFLKYNFQARIGNMDGVFVAYHNTARLFGFQYVPVAEMEDRLYGPGHPDRGSRIFEKCVGLMEAIMERITNCFPGYSLSCTIETKEDTNRLDVWVLPIDFHAYPTPILKFIVTVRQMVNDIPVEGKVAIERAHHNWTVQYFITQSSKTQGEIWDSLMKCQRRATFPVFLPEGVSAARAREQLESVNWGGGLGFQWDPEDRISVKSPDEELTSDDQKSAADKELTGPMLKAEAHGLIAKLRKMARRGRTDMEEENSIEANKTPVMWGRDPDIVGGGLPSQCNPTANLKTACDTRKDSQSVTDEDQTLQARPSGNRSAQSVESLYMPSLPSETPETSDHNHPA